MPLLFHLQKTMYSLYTSKQTKEACQFIYQIPLKTTWRDCVVTLMETVRMIWFLRAALNKVGEVCIQCSAIITRPFFSESLTIDRCRLSFVSSKSDLVAAFVIAVPESKVHGANIGPTWVLSAPDGPHVGLMNFAIRGAIWNIIKYWTAL